MERSENIFSPLDVRWLREMRAVKARDAISNNVFYYIKIKHGYVEVWRTDRGNYVARVEGPWDMVFVSQPNRFLKKAFAEAIDGFMTKCLPIVDFDKSLRKIKEKYERTKSEDRTEEGIDK